MPTLLDQQAMTCVDEALSFVVPQVMQPMAEWLREHFRDREGGMFRESQVPWVTAPEGPCDAIDNVQYNELWLQWAARTFKTTLGQSAINRRAHQAPCQMMFATGDQNLCKKIVRRWWQQLDCMPPFYDTLPVDRLRNATNINWLHNSANVIGTWAGSKTGFADESIQVGHANEVDKWRQDTTATEGDPLPRFLKRGGEYPDRKFLIESTPGERRISRIERGRLRGTNHKLQVPCPHCHKFQEIVFGDGKKSPGIFWKKTVDGKHDLVLASKTAYYVCLHCESHIYDEDRFMMTQKCVWVPEGCQVDHDSAMRARELGQFNRTWLIGEPARDGNLYSSQLSVFHAMFHGYGTMAADFIKKLGTIDDRRQWINEEAGDTWSRAPKEQAWRDLYARLHDANTPGGIVPDWASLLTMAVDRQKEHFVFMIMAWGTGRRCHVVDYGEVESLEDLREQRMLVHYPYADGKESVPISFTLIDNGYRPDSAVEDFCKECVIRHKIQVWTCEGAETSLASDYEPRNKSGNNPANKGMLYFFVDGGRTQMWIEEVLHGRKFGDEGSGSIHAGSVDDHQDLLEQILNEQEEVKPNRTGHDKVSWNRISRDIPNDFRDCWRYNYVAMLAHTRNRAIKPRGESGPVKKRSAIISSGKPAGGSRW